MRILQAGQIVPFVDSISAYAFMTAYPDIIEGAEAGDSNDKVPYQIFAPKSTFFSYQRLIVKVQFQIHVRAVLIFEYYY
uniref:Uncharacterized protein n=1 Tax=Rhizophora mucronata TaxID=61149 RepID=A0A2P2J025_RHIMU